MIKTGWIDENVSVTWRGERRGEKLRHVGTYACHKTGVAGSHQGNRSSRLYLSSEDWSLMPIAAALDSRLLLRPVTRVVVVASSGSMYAESIDK